MFHTRAAGHNIIPFLEHFNSSPEHELTFIYAKDRTFFPEKCKINFIRFSFSPTKIIRLKKTISKNYDLVWFHGGHSALIFYFFIKWKSKGSHFIFNVWNEWLIKRAQKNTIKSFLFRSAFKKADVIHCNWHGTAELVKETGWNNNVRVFYWGLNQAHFEVHNEIETAEAKEFINSLPANKTKFFFPKSISSNSRHDLIIEACAKLVEQGVSNFIVYFWLGNTNNEHLLAQYRRQIQENHLQEHVIIQSHGFLPFSDLQLIWKEMDAGLQIAANEQLSTTFLEPLWYKKELLVTNILPYRIFNSKFQLEIPLLPLQAEEIKSSMEQIIKGYRTPEDILQDRHKLIGKEFNLKKNIRRITSHYQELLSIQ